MEDHKIKNQEIIDAIGALLQGFVCKPGESENIIFMGSTEAKEKTEKMSHNFFFGTVATPAQKTNLFLKFMIEDKSNYNCLRDALIKFIEQDDSVQSLVVKNALSKFDALKN